jgi:hypothetical protein
MSKILHRGGEQELVVGEFVFWDLIRYLKEVAHREPECVPLYMPDGSDAQYSEMYVDNQLADELAHNLPLWGEQFDKLASESTEATRTDWLLGMGQTCRRVAEWSKGGAWMVEV